MTALVIGLGTDGRGDDAVGPLLACALGAALTGVDVVEHEDPTDLVLAWAEHPWAIVADAVVSGAPAGTVLVAELADGGATGPDGPAGPAGGHPSAGDSAGVCSLAELAQRMRAAGENQRRVTVVRVGEVLQVDVDLLAELQTAGLRPGAATTVDLADNDGRVKLQGELGHATVTLHAEEQRHLYTACDLH